ncbi:hypothetical protein FNF27_01765 [Cafeteria roenbergensis]|uniref:Uncharacterized protein n=1 Tax=Cafeteria roenbergensis TaxID=33653 RepID=A0A5A8EGC1_CAFRO|nr:hypothetical protein FNF27_01765 [Cafeteria roenbergensis]
MPAVCGPRRGCTLIVFLLLITIAIASSASSEWLGWSLAAVIAGIVLMLDLLFDDSAFVFEPSFAAWQRKSGNS